VSVCVRFSADELERLKQESKRVGMPVSAVIRKHALTRPSLPTFVSIGSNNIPSNPPSTPETSSGIRVKGYSGTYTPTVGKNR